MISDYAVFTPQPEDGGVFIARFSVGSIQPGDANGDGSVGMPDALLVLRASMGLITPQHSSAMDVNGDGSITAADAVLITRRAMNLF